MHSMEPGVTDYLTDRATEVPVPSTCSAADTADQERHHARMAPRVFGWEISD